MCCGSSFLKRHDRAAVCTSEIGGFRLVGKGNETRRAAVIHHARIALIGIDDCLSCHAHVHVAPPDHVCVIWRNRPAGEKRGQLRNLYGRVLLLMLGQRTRWAAKNSRMPFQESDGSGVGMDGALARVALGGIRRLCSFPYREAGG